MVFCNFVNDVEELKEVLVTILILVDGFLQYVPLIGAEVIDDVTILILVDGFLQSVLENDKTALLSVTILILVDGFLQ